MSYVYDIHRGVRNIKTKTTILLAAGALAAAAIVGALAFGGGQSEAAVGGPTCRVPADYSTIQAAVDDAGCNTVKVSPGTYNESVNITRSVKLLGAKSNTPYKWRTFAGVHESTINGSPAVTINADNVKVDGFSITNPVGGTGVLVKTAGDGAKVEDNIVSEVGNSSLSSNAQAVYLENGPDNVTVADNEMSNIQSILSNNGGVFIGDSTSNDPSLGILVKDNLIADVTSTTKGGYGIHINNGAGSSATGYTTLKILDNTVKDIAGNWVHAIALEGDTPNVAVKGNKVEGLNPNVPTIDVVAVWFEDNVFFFTGDVNRNSLDVGDNAFGIAVNPSLTSLYPTLSANGTCNWWGAKSGPGAVASGSGSLVSPGVDYKPWSKSSHLNGKCGDKNDYDDHHHGFGSDDKDHWWGSWDD
jgi:hypothetical protein